MDFCVSPVHQADIIHEYCTKEKPDIGVTLGMSKTPEKYWSSCETAMKNIGSLLNCEMVRGKSSNDAMSLRNNLLLGIASIRPAETADDEAKAEFEKEMKETKQTMNLTKAARRALDKMCDVRSDIFTSPDKHKLTLLQQTRRRYEARKINSALIKDFHVWLHTQCPLVINSPNKHDVIKTIDDNGEKVELRMPMTQK